jgi:uncharacterized membrane protein YgdD (TMEM256/DUF423 family)
MGRSGIFAGAVFGFLAVALGAFGAHALKPFLLEHNRLETFELAVRYHFFHALALLACGILQQTAPRKQLDYAIPFFIFGICFFSGSLFLLCFSSLGAFALLTPFGGLLLLIGWALLAIGYFREQKK